MLYVLKKDGHRTECKEDKNTIINLNCHVEKTVFL